MARRNAVCLKPTQDAVRQLTITKTGKRKIHQGQMVHYRGNDSVYLVESVDPYSKTLQMVNLPAQERLVVFLTEVAPCIVEAPQLRKYLYFVA